MGRFLVVPLAALLALAAVSPVAAGAKVMNGSGSFTEAYGSWSSYDESSGASTYGEFLVFQTEEGGQLDYLVEESGTYVDCGGGDIGKEDTGENYGFVGTRTYGWGAAQLTLARRLTSGSASGQVYFETATVDDCAGIWKVTTSGEAALAVVLTGTGDLLSFKSSQSIKVPGTLNTHDSYKGIRREAAGTIDFGLGARTFDQGEIARVTWTDHCNGSGCGY
jgi:hypothetical protein